jgi:glycosyltransferase involved in cell wall biosynthesis
MNLKAAEGFVAVKCVFIAIGVTSERLARHEFYNNDVTLLRSLGFNVVIATRIREIPDDAEIAVVWWWNYLWLVGPVLNKMGLPVITIGAFDPAVHKQRPWWKRKMIERGIKYSHYNVFSSDYVKEGLIKYVSVANPIVCPLVVAERYQLANSENCGRDSYSIFCVAWKSRANMLRKMQVELLDAFAIALAREPKCRLVLAGEPMDGQVLLERRAAELGISYAVTFTGAISHQAKLELMQSCGVYYQCSLSEGFGLALAEAMACGAAVVVNRAGSIPEVVGDTGFYVTESTPLAIADTMLEVIGNPDRARQIGLAAARRVDERFRQRVRARLLASVLNRAQASWCDLAD